MLNCKKAGRQGKCEAVRYTKDDTIMEMVSEAASSQPKHQALNRSEESSTSSSISDYKDEPYIQSSEDADLVGRSYSLWHW